MKKQLPETVQQLLRLLVTEMTYKPDNGLPDRHYIFDLMADHATIDMKDPSGMTPLLLAMANNFQDIAEKLIALGADIHAQSRNGNTALHYAACFGMTKITAMLINAGLDINATDRQGNTPLMLAACHGREDAVQRLIKTGADIGRKDDHGRTAKDCAAERMQVHTYKLLQEAERVAAERKAQLDTYIARGLPLNAATTSRRLVIRR